MLGEGKRKKKEALGFNKEKKKKKLSESILMNRY